MRLPLAAELQQLVGGEAEDEEEADDLHGEPPAAARRDVKRACAAARAAEVVEVRAAAERVLPRDVPRRAPDVQLGGVVHRVPDWEDRNHLTTEAGKERPEG